MICLQQKLKIFRRYAKWHEVGSLRLARVNADDPTNLRSWQPEDGSVASDETILALRRNTAGILTRRSPNIITENHVVMEE